MAERGTVWDVKEIEALIAIWSEEKIQSKFKSAGHRNQEIFEEISKKLQNDHNYNRTAQQCRTKLKKLRLDFAAVEDNNRRSGNERKLCKFYDLLAPILKDKADVNPKFTKCSNDVGKKRKGKQLLLQNL